MGFFQVQVDSAAEIMILNLEYPPIQVAVPNTSNFQVELVKDPNIDWERPAEFPGGMTAFYQYLGRSIQIPEEVRKGKVSGKVLIGFVVDSTGRIPPDQVTIAQSLCVPCDEAAVKVIRGSPRWKPGSMRGKPTNQQMYIPITFK